MATEEKAFDISDPPLHVTNPVPKGTVAPVGYQEYPRHLHRADGTYLVVTTEAEKMAALADGWCLTRAEALLAEATAAEAPRRGPGRPKAVEAGA